MKLEPVTKLDKRNKTTSKNLTIRHVKKIDFIAIFSICSQFEAIRKLDSSCVVVVPFNLSLIVAFYLTKSEHRTKKSLMQLSHNCFE